MDNPYKDSIEVYKDALEGMCKAVNKKLNTSDDDLAEMISIYGNIKLNIAKSIVKEVMNARKGF
jgi:hypothetical protein